MMASEGSRLLEEALKLMAEAIKLKLAEMGPSSGAASPSTVAGGTHAPGETSVHEVESAPAAVLTEEQRVENFMKNWHPRWMSGSTPHELTIIEGVAQLFGRDNISLIENFLNLPKKLDPYLASLMDTRLGGGTALHWAVRMEDLEAVTRILNEGHEAGQDLDVNAMDTCSLGRTALHWAVWIGNMDIVKAMCAHHLASGKFDFKIKDIRGDNSGFTALEHALLKSNVSMVDELLQFGYDGVIKETNDELRKGGSMEVLERYFEQRADDWFDVVGTFFHWVVKMEDTTLASQILTEGKVNVNGKDKAGCTPLHLAVQATMWDMDMVRVLIADGRVDVNVQNKSSYTPLHLAVLLNNVDAVKVMVDKHLELGNFDVNVVEHGSGYTILHCAVEGGDICMVRELLKCKETMRLTEECKSGETPLQIAHRRGFKDIRKSLMECAAVQAYVGDLYRDRQVYVDAANAILVGAALIASVTFASWLQPPTGIDKLGYVDVQHDRGLRAFWIFNCLSFYFAIGTVVSGARSVLPREEYFIKVTVEKLRKNLLLTAFLLACSVFFVIIAFGIAGYIVLSPEFVFKLYMVIPTIIGGLVCIVSLVFLFKSMWQESTLGKFTCLVWQMICNGWGGLPPYYF